MLRDYLTLKIEEHQHQLDPVTGEWQTLYNFQWIIEPEQKEIVERDKDGHHS